MAVQSLATPEQAAAYIGVTRQTLARWRVEGGGPAFLKLGGRVRYDLRDLETWINAGRRRSTAQRERKGTRRAE